MLRFAREAAAAGKLSHPNIVTVYQLGEDRDLQYLVLELVDGCSLEKVLASGHRMDRKMAISVLSQVANGLDHAHAAGVVHRDVKPGNILLGSDGMVKITDFGIARISSQTVTRTGVSMGTPSYMAPEQLMSAKVTGKADQFSLAVVAYQVLSGRRPFLSDTDPGVMLKIVSEDPPPLHELDRSFPPRTSDILRRGLAKDPDHRFATCAEFIGELASALDDRVPEPPPAPEVRYCSRCGQSALLQELTNVGGNMLCRNCIPRPAPVMPARPAVQYGGFWIRAVALFFDSAILSVAVILPLAMLGLAMHLSNDTEGTLGMIAGLVIGAVYEGFFISRSGSTPGKMALGLRVVRPDGSRVSFVRAVGRCFVKWLGAWSLGIGCLIAGFDAEKRSLHDMAAGTRVVKTGRTPNS